MKDKKTKIAIISVVALLLLLIGITYAYWLVTKTQTNSNIISSACLDITLDDESAAINLGSQYPMSDEDGMKLTPYTFTVTNNCNTSIDYQISLESIGDESTAIKSSAIKVALDNNINLLIDGGNVAPTISEAYEANKLMYGTLTAKETDNSSASHSLRIWIDENAPISEANKTFQSKISVTIGQEIKNPYKEGMLAYDILSQNGGVDSVTTVSTIWTEGTPASETYNSVGKTSNYWYGTSYEWDKETGRYKLSGDLVQATLTECREGTKECGMYTLKWGSTSYTSNTIYKITSFTSTEKTDTASTLYMTTQKITAYNNFSIAPTESDAGLYKAEDDLGESFYYRGNVTSNYVQFGAYESGATIPVGNFDTGVSEISISKTTPMYWRIVRVNGDGTIRLAYDGIEKVSNGTIHSANIDYTIYNTEEEVGYTFDTNVTDSSQIDSKAKESVDTWYNSYLKERYDSYIADGIFCNDKEIATATYLNEDLEITSEENAYYYDKYFEGYNRLYTNKKPELSCSKKEYRYTVSGFLGNGLLTYPVGLLTADEVMFAGGTSNSYYLYSGDYFWTSTPFNHNNQDGAFVYNVDGSGDMQNYYVNSIEYGIRPVINLRADVEFTGNGSFETPYVIKTN